MTPNREDYLKIIMELGGDKKKISNKQIVSGLNVSAASVSEMITKLVKEGLVEHFPYQGAQLTKEGMQKASTLIRRHRLWEVFLVKNLDYSWNAVHDDAEVLEHIASEELTARLEEFLDFPDYCPHGGMIPKKDDIVEEKERHTLSEFPEGTHIRIARVIDERELLDYMISIDLNINDEFIIKEIAAYEGPVIITNDQKTISLSFKAASTIFVDKL